MTHLKLTIKNETNRKKKNGKLRHNRLDKYAQSGKVSLKALHFPHSTYTHNGEPQSFNGFEMGSRNALPLA